MAKNKNVKKTTTIDASKVDIKKEATKKMNSQALKDMPKPTEESMVRHKILLFLEKMDNNANDSNIYLESHLRWLLAHIDAEDEEMWPAFNGFLHYYNQVMQTYRELGSYIVNAEPEESSSNLADVKEQGVKNEKELN